MYYCDFPFSPASIKWEKLGRSFLFYLSSVEIPVVFADPGCSLALKTGYQEVSCSQLSIMLIDCSEG